MLSIGAIRSRRNYRFRLTNDQRSGIVWFVGRTIQVSEETLLADIERRLVDEFPRVAPAAVNTLIREEHARFETSRIRDFVPLLVEKHARRELKHASRRSRQMGDSL